MAQVTVTVHGRQYQVACEDGQETHVEKLASYIDQRVRELAKKSGVPGPAGQITESRLLVMAALLIADELGDTYDELEELRRTPPRTVPDPATVKAAEEARAAASAAKAQLAEAEAASRAAAARAQEAEAARRAAEELAASSREALSATDARLKSLEATLEHAAATSRQGEAALQAALTRVAELEAKLREADAERVQFQATVASLTANAERGAADEERMADLLDGLAGRIEAMAERLERAPRA